MSNFSLQDKTVIVTGGAGRLGRPMCAIFAAASANVIVASRSRDKIEAEAASLREQGYSAAAIEVDVTDEQQVNNLIEQTVSTFGAVDVMVNNAGRWGRSSAAEDTQLDEWRNVVEQNLTGVFLPCKVAGQQMIKQHSGKIINISSTAGSKGNPYQLHYSAAKAGVISLTNNLACLWAKHNINVNCIAPGLTATEGVAQWLPAKTKDDGSPVPPLEYPPDPQHVADLTLFLAAPASKRISGEIFPIRALTEIV